MMKVYKTSATVRFPSGTVLGLSAAQAAARGHALEEMEPGVFVAKDPVEFKSGETLSLMETPPRGQAGLEPVEAAETEGSAKTKKAAK